MADSEQDKRPAGVTLHIVPEIVWLAQEQAARYLAESFSMEGFIHCTDGDDLAIEVGNRYYRDDPRPYVVLDVDLDRLEAHAVYEDDERRYPHVYGPIERHAVRRVRRVERAADGTFSALGTAPESLP